MCGIAGLLSLDGASKVPTTAIEAMVDTLSQRGPDGRGLWQNEDGTVTLGHRRLAILDLDETGHQPMSSSSGRYTISYNGEIYNFQKLREDLRKQGHTFRGTSDTEVLLAGIEQWGLVSALSRMEGMFAFALWDDRTRRLSIVRDRIGEKPLYYGRTDDLIYFCSQLGALLELPLFDPRIDRRALQLYFRYNYVPTPHAIYEDVAKLEPGTILSISANDGRTEKTRYWSPTNEGAPQRTIGSLEEAADGLEDVLGAVVEREMVADVPLGALLSGGIDSSLVTALMQDRADRPVNTYSIGFFDQERNEAHHARRVAEHLGTDHTEFYTSSEEAREVVPQLPQLYDEPFADSSQIPTFIVSRLARQHVTVALSGDGGDELFGGYDRYPGIQRVWSVVSRIPGPIRRLLASGLTRVRMTWTRNGFGSSDGEPPSSIAEKVEKLEAALEVNGSDELYQILTTVWDEHAGLVRDSSTPVDLESGIPWSSERSPRENAMLADLLTYLPDDILVKVDRASMGVGLEVRAPFLNHKVVEFALGLPVEYRVDGTRTKRAPRKLLHRYVPKKLVERPKSGFGVPLARWLRGPLKGWAEQMLDPDRLTAEGYLAPAPIQRRFELHLDGEDWSRHLWSVLMFQSWLAEQPLGVQRA